MGKLDGVSRTEVVTALERLGFVRVSKHGSHVKMRHANGRMAIVPLHAGDMPAGTLRGILRQAGVTPDEFAAVL
jgi:predicted RNA binding protein YcfA (HicA-like mRNA interferase family)